MSYSIRKKQFGIFFLLLFMIVFCANTFASPYTLCTGKEFNDRVKAFLSGNDRNAKQDYTITTFERGYNPPDDPAYYVDVSEDKDGSVIVYITDNNINVKDKKNVKDFNYTLYWYSDYIVTMNPNAAYMFDRFLRLRRIDITEFAYVKGLNDTRYMFSECRNLKTLKFRSSKDVKPFTPSEMQGMFFSCQSLTNIDLSIFDTHNVDNMDEMFFKCYNLKNIYVDKARWNIESVRTFNRMFSQCHLLRSNEGRKAVDVAEDNYEKYAIPGDKKVEGFLKDINTTYSDYGEHLGSVPIDGINYVVEAPETTQAYAEEPEEDGVGTEGIGSAYVGDKASGYGAEKEQRTASGVITQPTEANPITESQTSVNVTLETESIVVESSIVLEERPTQVIETSNVAETSEIIESSVVIESTFDDKIETQENKRRIVEIDEYLREQGLEDGGNGGRQADSNYKFMLLTFFILVIVIFLLVGMVIYLYRDKKEQ